jgi:sugar lactone lactonase YvrE
VCDRETSRIQIFRKDGTFVEEAFVAKEIPGAVVTDLGFSHDATQRFVYVVDHATHKVWILEREGMEVVGSFGQGGHFGGSFTIPHNIAVDSQGNLYVTEGLEGKRVQRFLYTGLRNE